MYWHPGYPTCIDATETRPYRRNQLIFNLVFAIRRQGGERITPYIMILEKLARNLHQLEVESGYIWQQSTQVMSGLSFEVVNEFSIAL